MCHWCKLSLAEWEDCDHEKGDMWSIQLIKDNLEEQRINLDMIPSEKKGCVLPMFLMELTKPDIMVELTTGGYNTW